MMNLNSPICDPDPNLAVLHGHLVNITGHAHRQGCLGIGLVHSNSLQHVTALFVGSNKK